MHSLVTWHDATLWKFISVLFAACFTANVQVSLIFWSFWTSAFEEITDLNYYEWADHTAPIAMLIGDWLMNRIRIKEQMWWPVTLVGIVFAIYHSIYTVISGEYTYAILRYDSWLDLGKVLGLAVVGFTEFWILWGLDQIKWHYFIGFDKGQMEGDEVKKKGTN